MEALSHFSLFEVVSYALLAPNQLASADKITSGRGGRKPEFGEKAIRALLKMYSSGNYPLFASSKEQVDIILGEFCHMQTILLELAKNGKSSAEAWHEMNRLHAADIPNMIKLYAVYRLYPTATAIVERGFQHTP